MKGYRWVGKRGRTLRKLPESSPKERVSISFCKNTDVNIEHNVLIRKRRNFGKVVEREHWKALVWISDSTANIETCLTFLRRKKKELAHYAVIEVQVFICTKHKPYCKKAVALPYVY